MNFLDATRRYYARWTGVDPSVFDRQTVMAACSPERDVGQAGYSRPFALYCLLAGDAAVISYSRRLEGAVGGIVGALGQVSDTEERADTLAAILPGRITHSLKFSFTELPSDLDTSRAVELTAEDFPEYRRFFEAVHPGASFEGLQEYFSSVAGRHYAYGVFQDDRLASATDAPDMPYMSDLIVEPGINTIEEYRRQGYARIAAGAMVRYLVENGKVPIWSCDAGNRASAGLAESLGYVPLAHVLTATLDEGEGQS